ncbi:MAG: hypothetical protein JNK12_14850 [Acidimicrobiales bacterium]|nr:hypothetical protein [Acidimicrobiales bacterium]
MSTDIDWADAAHRAGEQDALGPWVREFLCSPGSDNAELADLLMGRMASWHGPVPLPIDLLGRLAGPRDAPVLVAVEDHEWRDDVEDLERRLAEGWQPAPVIVTFRDGGFALEDGNHRVEGLRRAGRRETWAVVGFEDEADRELFEVRHGSGATGAGA